MLTKNKKIAIVGMACRFPGGAESPEAYWDILKNGKDVITEVGSDRWSTDTYWHPNREEPGKSYTFSAGVLPQIDQFDAEFFGISPREAAQMDPQQRLLLELTWEALEDGGKKAEDLAGSQCAVYVGIASNDYAHRRTDDMASIDAYSMTGATASIASNRISYVFDLRGPSMSIDTACSSALVAVHQACKSLLDGGASMAIAGGVNMLLHPFPFVGFSKASMISPEGRCKVFDESGRGYVRSEGAGIVLLKLLDQAEKDGDQIHAVILASNVNCDGHTSGITVPGIETQGILLNSVYEKAGVTADQLIYLEAHGTGTTVGDPIEATAIGRALGQSRDNRHPLPIGSVKTNVGHLETTSGMAGMLKVILSLKHRAIPPSLHFKTPNPNIDFEHLNLRVVTAYTPLPETAEPLLMGVNSFGFGGANAHVLLRDYRADKTEPEVRTARVPPLFLSARSEGALRELALRYHALLSKENAPDYYDLAYSSLAHRQVLEHRLAVLGNTQRDIVRQLQAYANEETTTTLVEHQLLNVSARLALVFTGNGSQWQGMGCALLKQEPVFRETIEKIDALMSGWVDYSLLDEFQLAEEDSRLDQTEIAQPLLFALQVGIVQILRVHGLQVDAVVGHSVGEVAAAWASGALTLEQAVRVIHERSHAQAETRGAGRMAAVGVSAEQLKLELQDLELEDQIEIAGYNSAASATLSGSLEALNKLGERLSGQGKFYRLLDLDYAFHSRHMNPVGQRVKDALKDLEATTTQIPYVSTVTGGELAGTELAAEYWWRNIREPVLFGQAIEALIDDGIQIFLEVGPHPILRHYVNECLKNREQQGEVLHTLSRKEAGRDHLLQSIYKAHLAGCQLDLKVHFPEKGQYVPLPLYPWQRERHWYSLTAEGYDLVNRHREHPLLGYRLKETKAHWENQIDTALLPYLVDHVVDDAVVFPAAAYVEMALAASTFWFSAETHTLENLEILAPIVLDEHHAKITRFALNPEDGSFTIRSKDRLMDDPWTLNVKGRLTGEVFRTAPAGLEISFSEADCIDQETHYQLAEAVGLSYGEAFQGISKVQVAGHRVIARLTTPDPVVADLDDYVLHPSLLDSCFQVLVDLFAEDIVAGRRNALIPVQLGRLFLYVPHARVHYLRASLLKQSPRSVLMRFELLDEAGHLLAELENCRFRGITFNRTATALPAIWEFQPLLKPGFYIAEQSVVPVVDTLLSKVRMMLEDREETLRRTSFYQHILPLIDVMVSSYAWQAVRKVSDGKGLVSTAVAQTYQPLLQRLLAILEEDEFAWQKNGQWYLNQNAEVPDAEDIWLSIVGEYPACLPELMLLSHFGHRLDQVLQGLFDADVWQKWFSGNSWNQLYDVAPSYRAANLAVQKIVEETVAVWPANRRLRILELDTGEGILTRRLLPALSNKNYDYYVTADTEEAVAGLRIQFERQTLVSVAMFNPDTDQVEGMEDDFCGFDLVIAANRLHQSEELESALKHIRRKMQPSGLLVLLERWPDRFSDLTSGLNSQWWHWDDQTETAVSPLLSPDEWQLALRAQGFTEITPFVEASAITASGVWLILAKNVDTVALEKTEKPDVKPETWLLLLDDGKASQQIGQYLSQALQNQGQNILFLEAGSAYQQKTEQHVVLDIGKLEHFMRFVSDQRFEHVVHLMGLSLGADEFQEMSQESDALQQQDLRCISTLHLLQALEQQELTPRLWLITSGAAVLPSDDTLGFVSSPVQAPLWGLGRVIINEHPELQCHLVDVQTRGPNDDLLKMAKRLGVELLNPGSEDEIVLTDEARYVLRLQKTLLNAANDKKNTSVCLDFSSPGPLKNLYWKKQESRMLKPDQIEIRPHASGLNFRDIMYAMGLLSDEAVENGFAGATLGMEVSGVVTRIGDDVTEFNVGDVVMGFAPACFSSDVITETTAITHKPAHWTDEEAATVPTTFFTVYYALHHLAQLQPDEKVLIHGAAGGVGIAAIQFARYRGAEIFATAGSEEKRTFVKLMGADHVMDSRSLAFADEILAITEGQGIDVVLNSISGEAINRNLLVLRPFGRFLELGKRDFYENSKVGLRPFRNNISYFGIDADQLLIERPALAGKLFREMMALFNEGVLRPLPHRVFSAGHIEDAFRYMQQSRHIGKVVVSFAEGVPEPRSEIVAGRVSLSAEGSYLVSGGLSGFGLKTARWLVSKGARSLVLLGRRGAATEEAENILENLRAAGVSVLVKACDVTDKSRLNAVFADIEQNLPPLRGVIHAAMVIDDGLLRNLDRERFQAVLRPKIEGAWHLHELTQSLELDFFVMYSSATTLFGNPGQANYVAANYYLEALANYRRLQGMPGLYVAWGAIADAGFLARNEAVKDALQSRLGGSALTSEQALNMLEKLLLSEKSGAAVIDFDWRAIQRVMPAAKSAKYEVQNLEAALSNEGEHTEDIHALMASLSDEEIQELISSLLVKEISQILRLPVDKILTDKSVLDLGMDSLMGMELVMAIEERFAIRLPLMALTEGASIHRIAEKICEQLAGTGETEPQEDDAQQMIASASSVHGEELTGGDIRAISDEVSLKNREAVK